MLGNWDVPATWDQVLLHQLAELVVLVAEGHVEPSDVVVENVPEVFIVLGVDVLVVLDGEGLSQDVFVERPGEIGVEHVPIVESLADELAHELKVLEMVLVHEALWTRLEGDGVGTGLEERVVGVEDFAGEQQEPLTSEASDVHALLADELDGNLVPERVGADVPELGEGVPEDLGSVDLKL